MKRPAIAILGLAASALTALCAVPAHAQTTLVSNTFEGFSVINVETKRTAASRSNSRPGPMRRDTR